MPDEDIMDKLMEIEDDEILGEEIHLDDELDFEGLEDMDNPPETSPIAPSSSQTKVTEIGEVKSKKTAKKSTTKVKKTNASATAPETTVPAPTQTGGGASVTEVGELVIKAKVLRIIAGRVIIEPGDNISLSSS